MWVLGGDANIRPTARIVGLKQLPGLSHHQSAIAELEVDRLVKILFLFEKGILADNAEIGAAVLNIGRHISGAHRHETVAILFIFEDELAAAAVFHLRAGDADAAKQGHRILHDPPLGQGKGNPVAHIKPCRMR